MKLSEWARREGIDYSTARRWFHSGILPVEAHQLPTGTILVEDAGRGSSGDAAAVVIYARVSGHDQKADLDRQVARLAEYASKRGLSVAKTVTEIGSGLNGERKKLARVLRDPEVSTILVEHRDRLARFGFSHLEASLAAQGRRVVVTEEGEVEDDLTRDVVEVLTSFCARLHGRRSAKRRAERALAAAADKDPFQELT